MTFRTLTVLAAALALCACSAPTQSPTPSATPAAASAPPAAAPSTDAWIGKWTGVEGNFLDIRSGGLSGVYAITEGTLDGQKHHTGHAKGAGVDFVDGDKIATIHAGTGRDTGLKYLEAKTDCLVIESGRGFCR